MENNFTFTVQCDFCNAVENVENVSKKGSDISFEIASDVLLLHCLICKNEMVVKTL